MLTPSTGGGHRHGNRPKLSVSDVVNVPLSGASCPNRSDTALGALWSVLLRASRTHSPLCSFHLQSRPPVPLWRVESPFSCSSPDRRPTPYYPRHFLSAEGRLFVVPFPVLPSPTSLPLIASLIMLAVPNLSGRSGVSDGRVSSGRLWGYRSLSSWWKQYFSLLLLPRFRSPGPYSRKVAAVSAVFWEGGVSRPADRKR